MRSSTTHLGGAPRFFDTHLHIFPERQAAAIGRQMDADSKTAGRLKGAAFRFPPGDDAMAILRADPGFLGGWLLPVGSTPDRCRALNDWVLGLSKHNPQISAFISLHPADEDIEKELDRCVERGASGVKLHITLQTGEGSAALASPAVTSLLALVEARGLPLVTCSWFPDTVHSGKDHLAWRLLDVAERFPNLTLIVAHLGAMQNWEVGLEPLLGSSLYLDLAKVPTRDPAWLVDVIRRHGPNHILFGSDSPFDDPLDARARIARLPLEEDELRMVMYANALRLDPSAARVLSPDERGNPRLPLAN